MRRVRTGAAEWTRAGSAAKGRASPSATRKKYEVENASSRACSKPTSLVIPPATYAGCVNFAERLTSVRFASLRTTVKDESVPSIKQELVVFTKDGCTRKPSQVN